MLDKDTKVIQGISTGGDTKTYINAKYWGDFEVKDVKTIGGKSIFKESDSDEIDIVIHTNSIIEIEYSELKELRDNSELLPGIPYKITNYVTSTYKENKNIRSARNQFDVIVVADSKNTLNENAKVCLHAGDIYFSKVNLDAWKIKYCLDNDTTRFTWADVDGTGVIYYMKDEFNNEAYYDFKNIQYNIDSYPSRPTKYNYAFTFTDVYTGNDLSLTKNVRNNVIKIFTNSDGSQSLNSTIFLCEKSIYDNILEENSSNNLIWVSSFYYNNIGREFQNNIISAFFENSKTDVHNNTIGNSFQNNIINSLFRKNKIGVSVYGCNFNELFSFNNIDNFFEKNDFYYPISYCDFGSYMRRCVFKNTGTAYVNEMKWCVFEGALDGCQHIPSCQSVTFQKALHTDDESILLLNETKLIDGRIMSEVLTKKHNEHLYVYRVGGNFGIYKNSEEKVKTITPLFSNPNLDFESTSNNINCYGYVGDLLNLNVLGNNILIDSIGVYVRGAEFSPNSNVPVWCRLLKYVNNTWEIISQSESCKSIDEINQGDLFTFKMVNKSNEPLLKKTDKIAIVYVSNEDSDVLSSVELGFKSISKSGGLQNKFSNNISDVLNLSPAFVFGYTIIDVDSVELNLGDFSNIDDVSSKSAEIDICLDQNTTIITFKIDDGEKNYSNGFIEQFISCEPYIINGIQYYYITQTLYFNGETSSRKIVYTIDGGVKNIHNIGNWNVIVDYKNNIDSPVLYSKNFEVLNVGSDQTITGNKRFDKNINIAGKTIIRNDINNGELKVFDADDENSGFIISANETFDNGIPKLEMFGTNNIDFYKYQFPQLENPNDTDIVVVKSQLNELINVIKENEKVTAVALNHLNDIVNSYANTSANTFSLRSVNTVVNTLIDITYSELVSLRDEFGLTPGMQYKIIDYVTTTSQENTQSAGHRFDIIVTANSENILNEEARACLNINDSYFYDGRANLDAWKIWYCLDNDVNRFEWADEVSGKGVIYRMIDEWGNDCPYDFKNIQFKRDNYENNYLYTFSFKNDDLIIKDASVVCNNRKELGGVYDNIIGTNILFNFKQGLNDIVFFNMYIKGIFYGCHSNTFGNRCYSNTFGSSCYNNTFGDLCFSNTFDNDCNYNTFGDYCSSNTLGYNCKYNNFGDDCDSIILGNYCEYNTFGNGCGYNTFGNYCCYNSFGNGCAYNYFKNISNDGVEYDNNYVYNVNYGNRVTEIKLLTSMECTISEKLMNISIPQGTSNIEEMIQIFNQQYELTISKDSSGKIKQFCLADL